MEPVVSNEVQTIDNPPLIQQDITDPNRPTYRLSLPDGAGPADPNVIALPAIAIDHTSFKIPPDQTYIAQMNRVIFGRTTGLAAGQRGILVDIGDLPDGAENERISHTHMSIVGTECQNLSRKNRSIVHQAMGFGEDGQVLWNDNELPPNNHTALEGVVEKAEDPTRIELSTVNVLEFPGGTYVLYYQPDRTARPDLWNMMRLNDIHDLPRDIKAKIRNAFAR